MKRFITCLFAVAAIVLIVVVFKIVSPYFFEKVSQKGLTEVSPKINVLVIDESDQTPEELLQHVENGSAYLLLWIENNKETDSKQAYTFNTLESLVRLEQNKMGFLDISDPGLKNLYIAQYDADKKILYYSAVQIEGITAIEASRNYLIGEVLSDPQNYKNPAGSVIYLNGIKKTLRMVKMPENQIEEALLIKSPKKITEIITASVPDKIAKQDK